MYNNNTYQTDKSVAAIKLVLSNLPDNTCGFHKLFKIFYFAEQMHLVLYGKTITKDRYIAMRAGPVPSNIYDMLKVLRGNSIFRSEVDLTKDFQLLGNHHIKLIDDRFDLEMFSESELECLSVSIEENKNLPFHLLTEKSHDGAWKAAEKDDTISVFEIAKAGGANDELLKYISQSLENHKLQIN